MFTDKDIIKKPHRDYIDALLLVDEIQHETLGEAPYEVEVQRMDGLLSPDEIWVQPEPIRYNKFDSSSLGDDFIIGFRWLPLADVRQGTARVSINAKESWIEVINNVPEHTHSVVGLAIDYLTAANLKELVVLIRRLITR
jgi:hypothetical protein